VADYARAQTQYRSGLASGDGDLVIKATDTFSLIAQEVLSRQDPRLFDAQVVCERYPVAGPHDPGDMRTITSRNLGRTAGASTGATIKQRSSSAETWKRGSRLPTARPIAQAEAGHP
jgi:hypothetical protein